MAWRRVLNHLVNNEKIIDELSKTKLMQESARAAHQLLNKAKQLQTKQTDVFVDFTTKQSNNQATKPNNQSVNQKPGWFKSLVDDARADLIDLERKMDSITKKR